MKWNSLLPLQSSRRTWIAYLVMGVTLSLTLVARVSLEQMTQEGDRLRFENAVSRTRDSIQRRLETYIALLNAGNGLLSADPNITQAQFQTFVSHLEVQRRYPGIQGIGFARRIDETERTKAIQQYRSPEGGPLNIRPPQPRPEYFPIVYLEPLDRRNKAAIGYDMFSEKVRRTAMQRARDTGTAAASGRVTLVQEIDAHKQAGFLIYVPVYQGGYVPTSLVERQAALRGFIYSPFRADDLLAGVLNAEVAPVANFAIYDGKTPSPDTLLHRSRSNGVQVKGGQPQFTQTVRLTVAGQPWTILFTSQPELNLATEAWVINGVTGAGILVSLVLGGLVRSQLRARDAAEMALQELQESQEALLRSETRFRTLVEQSPLSTQILSPQGETLQVNRAWEVLWGISLTDAQGYNLLRDPQLLEKGLMPEILRGFAGEAVKLPPFNYLSRPRSDASESSADLLRWVQSYIYPVKDEAGHIQEVVLVHQDITEQKHTEAALQASELRFRKLAEKVRIIPWEADMATGNFTYVGPQVVDILGYPVEAWYQDQFWPAHIHPEDCQGAIQFCLDSAQELDNYDFEYRMIAADGQEVWLYDLVNVVREAEEPKLLRGIMIDITERKRVESERLQLLDREQAARAAAEAANQMKDEFLATLSHELRTPLNAMVGWTRLLLTRKFDEATTTRALETIHRNTNSLAQLIEDLLDVSRIMTGKLRLEMQPVDLAAVLDLAIEAVQSAAEAKEIGIVTDFEPGLGLVSGDPTRLQQVCWNLLTNAIKFTPKGGLVWVWLSRDRSNAQVTVQDTGQGISPDFLPHIFERFRQADGTITRSHGGLGLGLSIVRQIVELHGGQVSVTSPGSGQGSTFTVTLPLRAVYNVPYPSNFSSFRAAIASDSPAALNTLESPATQVRNGQALQSMRILVVDDEADARILLSLVLEEQGAEVMTVSSAQEAIARLKASDGKGPPDILISDIGMPGEDGYALIRQVRNLPPEQGGMIPALALTAYAREEEREQALTAGFQVHLPKPVKTDELIAAIAHLTGRLTGSAPA